jgi:hypothetical protein
VKEVKVKGYKKKIEEILRKEKINDVGKVEYEVSKIK